LNKPVLFIMGNDDHYQWKNEDNFINISEICIEVKDINFVGYQYSNPFVGGQFERDELTQERDFQELAKIINNNTILVTHGPCHGILDTTSLGTTVGSRALLDLCGRTKPRYHFFGHIHESFGVKDNHFNLCYAKGRSALFMDLDSDEYEFVRL
jgi:Icc-related predicted phosphoesterase